MLDLDYIRKNAGAVQRAIELKGESAPLDELLEVDGRWRAAQADAERLRAEQNGLSKAFSQSRDAALLPRMKELATATKDHMSAADELRRQLDDLLLRIPNVFDESVPIGESEADNVVIREWGSKPAYAFTARTHFDLGEALDGFDFERAARVSGSRFVFLKAGFARLERALIQFMLDLHVNEHGYTEIRPPFLVNSEAMIGTGNLPKFGADAFRVEGRDLWLIPTAEVPVTNLHREEILDAERLPLCYVAHSPCFRSEAGAAGKDTRGYIRGHQFEKVELVKLTEPETSMQELEKLTADAEDVLQRLGLHYQVMAMCTADMGFAQFKKYDINAWAPGLARYLEVSSCSVFNDFQARRAGIRYRPGAGKPPRFVHTMNGSALALTRTVSAVIETYQRADGSIAIPEVLRPYMGGLEALGG